MVQVLIEVAVSNGYEGDEDQWFESLRGAVGAQGLTGENGFSAYELAIKNGFVGTEVDWLLSLKGTDPYI